MKLLYPFILLLIATVAHGQSIVGKWKTIDDNSKEVKSIVEIYKANDGKYYGKIVELYLKPNEDQDPTCTECDDDDARYRKKIRGMVIITALSQDGQYFTGGDILDPENGNVYRCKIWTEGSDKLMVRGYLGPFYRTQEWLRMK